MKRSNVVEFKGRDFECPNCGSHQVETHKANDKFQYGSGAKSVELEAIIPFRKCNDCGFEYTDFEAEDIRHATVCRHRGVKPPAEIVALRKKYEFSRAEFAARTHFGEASLARWETGELIQNAANDNYLFLLEFGENMERLVNRQKRMGELAEASVAEVISIDTFRSLDKVAANSKRKEAAGFRL